MADHKVVDGAQWLAARRELLEEEKEFTRLRDRLSKKRRELPWQRVDKAYVFEGANGKETLADLFAGHSQLIVYHFMLGPDWQAGCKACSFWADSFDGMDVHLAHRDVAFLAISRAPQRQIEAYKKRMGWRFKWVSSAGSDFNFDYHVSFTPEEIAAGEAVHNFQMMKNTMSEHAGISVFSLQDGVVFHTYSCYKRGLDMINGGYQLLDLVPKGRDEDGLPFTISWLQRHDEYARIVIQ